MPLTEIEAAEKLKKIPGALKILRSLFSKLEEAPAVKLSEVQTKDGSTLSIEGDAPAVGAAVLVVADTGNIPAPDGEYELADGSFLTVVSGKITEIEPAAEEAAEDDPSNVSMSTQALKGLTDRIDALEAKDKLREEALVAANKTIDKQKTELKAQLEILKETFAVVEVLGNLPAAKPTEITKKIDTAKEDRMIQLSKTIQELKTKV